MGTLELQKIYDSEIRVNSGWALGRGNRGEHRQQQ